MVIHDYDTFRAGPDPVISFFVVLDCFDGRFGFSIVTAQAIVTLKTS